MYARQTDREAWPWPAWWYWWADALLLVLVGWRPIVDIGGLTPYYWYWWANTLLLVLVGPLVYMAKQCLKWFIDNIDIYLICRVDMLNMYILKGTDSKRIWVLIFSLFGRNTIVSTVEPTWVTLFSVSWLKSSISEILSVMLNCCNATCI